MKALVFIYIFLFASLVKVHANEALQFQEKPQQAQQLKDCVKHPQIVKPLTSEKKTLEKVVKSVQRSGGNSIPHFSVLNFINFFYTKDSLDNLHVM